MAKPAYKARIGYVEAAVWENDGFYSVTISRNYKDDAGEYQSSSSLNHSDLLNAMQCLKRAETFIASKQE